MCTVEFWKFSIFFIFRENNFGPKFEFKGSKRDYKTQKLFFSGLTASGLAVFCSRD